MNEYYVLITLEYYSGTTKQAIPLYLVTLGESKAQVEKQVKEARTIVLKQGDVSTVYNCILESVIDPRDEAPDFVDSCRDEIFMEGNIFHNIHADRQIFNMGYAMHQFDWK